MSQSTLRPSPVPRDSENHSDERGDDEQARPRTGQTPEDPTTDATGSDSAPETDGNAEHDEQPSRKRRILRGLVRPRVALALVLTCALLAAATLLGIQWYRDNQLHEARSAAVRSAKEYALALTSYSYKHLTDDFAKVRSSATEEFAQEYKKVSNNLTNLIEKHKAVSDGKVLAAGLVSGDRNRAVVVLFVNQKIKNTTIDNPRIDRSRMRITLLHNNGDWLIDNVELL